MPKRTIKRVYRELTPAESFRLKKARAEVEADKNAIIERGRRLLRARKQSNN
jgi:hypothetical protein